MTLLIHDTIRLLCSRPNLKGSRGRFINTWTEQLRRNLHGMGLWETWYLAWYGIWDDIWPGMDSGLVSGYGQEWMDGVRLQALAAHTLRCSVIDKNTG